MIGEILAALFVAVIGVIVLWRKPWRRQEENLVAVEAWLETFSPESYTPMLRLAEKLDSGFLTQHRGPEEATRYKKLQRQILREYLRVLSRDFHRLHRLATESALRARTDPESSSLALVEEKLEFIFAMWSIELRLLLNEVAPCAVNLRPMLESVTQLTERAREKSRRRLEYRIS